MSEQTAVERLLSAVQELVHGWEHNTETPQKRNNVRNAWDLARSEVSSTPSSGNVFRDLGFENPEAELAAADARIVAHEIESDARFIAGLAADIQPHSVDGRAVYPGTPEADRQQVRRALALLAESRRQVAAERGSA